MQQSCFPSAFSLRFNPRRLTGSIDWHGHLCFAAWLMETVKPSTLVELGVFRGDSLATFSQAVRELELDCSITGIDTWGGDETTGTYDESVYSDVKDYFDVNYPEVTLFRGLFDEALPTVADGSIDILHIDGCHSYEAVKHDYETWRSKMSKRGIILFHDVSVVEKGFGTKQFWDEIKDTYPSFSFNHSNGLGVLLYGPKQPEQLKQIVSSAELLEVVRAVFEVTGAKFFHMAKEKWWHQEADKHAAYVSHITGDVGIQLAQTVAENVTAHIGHYEVTEHALKPDFSLRLAVGSLLRKFGLR